MELTLTSDALSRTIKFNAEKGNRPFLPSRESEYFAILFFVDGECRIGGLGNMPKGETETHFAPFMLCLGAGDRPDIEYSGETVYSVIFSPSFINVNMTSERMADSDWEELSHKHGLFELSPFMEQRASLKIIGTNDDETALYISLLDGAISATALTEDICWSCRIRAELMDILTGLEMQYEYQAFSDRDNAHNFCVWRNMLSYLHLGLGKNCNTSDICQKFGVNRNKLQKIFRSYTGKSFYGCVKEIKLEHAKKYLEFTDLSHGEIALRLGFSTSPHFYRFFREETGESPHSYRKHAVKERKEAFAAR